MDGKKLTKSLLKLAGASAIAGVVLKKQNICPVCVVKRALAATKINIDSLGNYDNNVALTPPMGWSSWNTFRHRINEDLIYETALAMEKSGLKEAGYAYVNIDDCWQSSFRDENGRLQGDLTTFPRGIKDLVQRVNKLGLKLGIYSSNGSLTCEDLPASHGYEAIDAETFAEWGIEYFKYDFCHNKAIPSSAPEIDKILIGTTKNSNEIVIQAETGELRGSARILEDSKLESGKFVGGLSSGNGSLLFDNVEVESTGEYVLTLGLRKRGLYQKYAEIVINDTDIYKVMIPSTKGFTHEGRHQITVNLNEGINTIKIHNPVGSRMDSSIKQYTEMGKHLKKATAEFAETNGVPEKPIVYSICEWGLNQPWKWGATAGNLWRTTLDINTSWFSIVTIYEFNVKLYKYAGIGGWNDPDMLEVGNGNLTDDENKAHFTLWCMMAAPLILGNDLRKFILPDGTPDYDNKTLKIVTNPELIAIDQDKRGVQCRRVKTNGFLDILAKPLENKQIALCFFNKSSRSMDASYAISNLCEQGFIDLPISNAYEIKDLWEEEVNISQNEVNAKIPSHGVKIFRIKAIGPEEKVI